MFSIGKVRFFGSDEAGDWPLRHTAPGTRNNCRRVIPCGDVETFILSEARYRIARERCTGVSRVALTAATITSGCRWCDLTCSKPARVAYSISSAAVENLGA